MGKLGDQLKRNLSKAAYLEYNGMQFIDAAGELHVLQLDPVSNPNIKESYTNAIGDAVEQFVSGSFISFPAPSISSCTALAFQEEGPDGTIVSNQSEISIQWESFESLCAWSSLKSYTFNEICLFNGVYYTSSADVNLNHLPTDESFWREISSPSVKVLVYRAEKRNGVYGILSLVGTVPEGLTELFDRTTLFNHQYLYRLIFSDNVGSESSLSAPVEISSLVFPTPAAPVDAIVTSASDNAIGLKFDGVKDSSVVNYRVQYREAPAKFVNGVYSVPTVPNWSPWVELSLSKSNRQLHSKADISKCYQYRYCAVNNFGIDSTYSPWSKEVIPIKTDTLSFNNKTILLAKFIEFLDGKSKINIYVSSNEVLPQNTASVGWVEGDNLSHSGDLCFLIEEGRFSKFDGVSGSWDSFSSGSHISLLPYIVNNSISYSSRPHFVKEWQLIVLENFLFETLLSKLADLKRDEAYNAFVNQYLILEDYFINPSDGILTLLNEEGSTTLVNSSDFITQLDKYAQLRKTLLLYFVELSDPVVIPSGLSTVDGVSLTQFLTSSVSVIKKGSTDNDPSSDKLLLDPDGNRILKYIGGVVTDITNSSDLTLLSLVDDVDSYRMVKVVSITTVPTLYSIRDLIIPSATFTVGGKTFHKNAIYEATKNSNSGFIPSMWQRMEFVPGAESQMRLKTENSAPYSVGDILIPNGISGMYSDEIYVATNSSSIFSLGDWGSIQSFQKEITAPSIDSKVEMLNSEDCVTASEKLKLNQDYVSLNALKIAVYAEIDHYYPSLISNRSSSETAWNNYEQLLKNPLDGLLISINTPSVKRGLYNMYVLTRQKAEDSLAYLKGLLEAERVVNGVNSPSISSSIAAPSVSLINQNNVPSFEFRRADTNSSSLRAYELQVCSDDSGSPSGSWWPLEIDGSDWKDIEFDGQLTVVAVDGLRVTQVRTTYLEHLSIPLTSGASLVLWYRVRSSLPGSISVWGSPASVTLRKPQKVSNLTAVAQAAGGVDSPERINISWDAVPNAIMYRVQRSENSGVSWSDLGIVNLTSYTDFSLGYNSASSVFFTAKRYRVIPINDLSAEGDTPTNSNEWAVPNTLSFNSYTPDNISTASIVVKPQRTAEANVSILISWAAPVRSPEQIDYYIIQIAKRFSVDGWNGSYEVRSSENSFLDFTSETNLAHMQSNFKYRIKAHNKLTGDVSNLWSESSAPSWLTTSFIDFSLTGSIPSCSANFLRKGDQVFADVSWGNYSGQASADVEMYEVLFSSDSGSTFNSIYLGSGNSLSHLVGNGALRVSDLTQFRFRVLAVSKYGSPKFRSAYLQATSVTDNFVSSFISSTFSTLLISSAAVSRNNGGSGSIRVTVSWSSATINDELNRLMTDQFDYVLLRCTGAWNDGNAVEVYRGLLKEFVFDEPIPASGDQTGLPVYLFKLKAVTSRSQITTIAATSLTGSADFKLSSVPPTPTAVAIRQLVTISWAAYTGTNSADVKSYEVYQSVNSGTTFETTPIYTGESLSFFRALPVAEEYSVTAEKLRYKVKAVSKYPSVKSSESLSSAAPNSSGYHSYIPNTVGINIKGAVRASTIQFEWNRLETSLADKEVDSYQVALNVKNVAGSFSLDLFPQEVASSDLLETNLWSVSGATSEFTVDKTLVQTSTGTLPYHFRNIDEVNGGESRFVYVCMRMITRVNSTGRILFNSALGGYSTGRRKNFTTPTVAAGWSIVKIDMTVLTSGESAWIDNTITGLGISLSSVSGDVGEIAWVAIGSDTSNFKFVKSNGVVAPLFVGCEKLAISSIRMEIRPETIYGITSLAWASQASDIDCSQLGTYIPEVPTMVASASKRSVFLRWNKQRNLLNLKGYYIQISLNGINWFAPNFQASADTDLATSGSENGWSPLLDNEQLTLSYLPIPLENNLPRSSGQTYFFRVKTVTRSLLEAISSHISATVIPTTSSDIAFAAINSAAQVADGVIVTEKLSVLSFSVINNPTISTHIKGWGLVLEDGSGTSTYASYDAVEKALKLTTANTSGACVRSKTFEVNHGKIYRVSYKIKASAANVEFHSGPVAFNSATEGSEATTISALQGTENLSIVSLNDRSILSTTLNPFLENNIIAPQTYTEKIFYIVGANRSVGDYPGGSNLDSIQLTENANYVALRFRNSDSVAGTSVFIKDISVVDAGAGMVVAENIMAGAVTAAKLNVSNLNVDSIANVVNLNSGLIYSTYTRNVPATLLAIASLTISVNSVTKTFTRSAGSWITDGIVVGNLITFTGANLNATNRLIAAEVTEVEDTVLTFKYASDLVTESGKTGVTATRLAVAAMPVDQKWNSENFLNYLALGTETNRISQLRLGTESQYLFVKPSAEGSTPFFQLQGVSGDYFKMSASGNIEMKVTSFQIVSTGNLLFGVDAVVAARTATLYPLDANNVPTNPNHSALILSTYDSGSSVEKGFLFHKNAIQFRTGTPGTVYQEFTAPLAVEITSAGRVGIGVSDPGCILTVNSAAYGNPATSGSTQTSGMLRLQSNGGNVVLDFGNNGSSGAWLQTTLKTDLSQKYPLLLNPIGGRVGIGTLAPGYLFQVSEATANSFTASIDNTAAGTTNFVLLRFGNDVGNGYIFRNSSTRSTDGGVQAMTIRNVSAILRLDTGSSGSGINISTASRVGIGLDASSEKLEVDGFTKATGFKTANWTITQVGTALRFSYA